MSWFNDVQSGIYNLVGMIDPSDPGYQGMLKGKYMEEHAKVAQAQAEAARLKMGPEAVAQTGYLPTGMKVTDNSMLSRMLRDVNGGVAPNEVMSKNASSFLLGGTAPSSVAMGTLNQPDVAQAGRYATHLDRTPQEVFGGDIQKSTLEQGLARLLQSDDHFNKSFDLSNRQFENTAGHQRFMESLGLAGQNLNERKFQAEVKGAGRLTPDDASKARTDFVKIMKDIQKVTGDPNNPLSVDDAITHASNNAITWAAPLAKLINGGYMTMDDGISQVLFSIVGPNPDPVKLAKAEEAIKGVLGSKNANSSTFDDSKFEGLAPTTRTMAQDFAGLIQKGLGTAPVFTSGLRTPEHNAAVGGVPNSSHLSGRALDLVIPGLPPEQEEMIKIMAQRMGFKNSLWHGDGDNHHLHLGE